MRTNFLRLPRYGEDFSDATSDTFTRLSTPNPPTTTTSATFTRSQTPCSSTAASFPSASAPSAPPVRGDVSNSGSNRRIAFALVRCLPDHGLRDMVNHLMESNATFREIVVSHLTTELGRINSLDPPFSRSPAGSLREPRANRGSSPSNQYGQSPSTLVQHVPYNRYDQAHWRLPRPENLNSDDDIPLLGPVVIGCPADLDEAAASSAKAKKRYLTCVRCGKSFKRYIQDEDEDIIVLFNEEECTYHPGEVEVWAIHPRHTGVNVPPNDIKQYWSCCTQELDAPGCIAMPAHRCEDDPLDILPIVEDDSCSEF